MSKELNSLRDPGSERTLLGTILNEGKDALIDSQGIVSATDFALPINKTIFTCLEHLADDPNCDIFDTESIKVKAKELGFESYFTDSKSLEYLELLPSIKSELKNIPLFGLQVKKYSIARDLYKRYDEAKNYVGSITGSETISDIIRNAEGSIVDFISGSDSSNKLTKLGDDIQEYIEELISSEPIDHIGISSGFPLYDEAIGGGIRPGTVGVTGARSGVGKSWLALNKARNVARQNIPVIYLDTELTEQYQKDRLLSIDSGCPIRYIETRQFNRNKQLIETVRVSAARISKYPFTYQNISGLSSAESLAIVRRWIVKEVGFNDKGLANPCLIIYDYLKLTDSNLLSKNLSEWLALGFLISDIHNFSIRYGVAFDTYVQLNREGIEGENTNIIAGSDRILWLCSSLSILRDKSETDEELGSGFAYGNKKISILKSRQGAGFEYERDYVNLKCSLRPRVSQEEGTGLITEGLLFTDISSQNRNSAPDAGQQDKPENSRPYSRSS